MSSEMTFEQAASALETAFETDGIVEGGIAGMPEDNSQSDRFDFGNEGLPQGQTQQTPAPTPPTGDPAPVAPEQTPAVEESFAERFDPNSLPPELQGAYRLMQADYTRKRQADAEAVRLYQQYQGQNIDLDAAAQLYQQVRDPDSLLSFVTEASDWLAQNGYAEFEDPDYEYQTEDIPGQGSNALTGTLQSLVESDPSMAPLAEAVEAMQARLDHFESTAEQRNAAEREEQVLLQAMGELQRQENVIRGSFPNYDDGDIEAIYEIASYHDGDLFQAQQSYEQMFTRRLGRYVGQKGDVVPGVAPMGGPSGEVPTAELNFDPLNLKEAHKAAMETLKLIESQPEA